MTNQPVKTEPDRVMIVEDHPVVRMGLKQLLLIEPNLAICGEAERVDEAIAMLDDARPQVVLVDLALPGTNGIELIRHLKKNWVGVKIIVVSSYDQTIYGPIAIEAGADFYINKQEAVNQIVQTIHSILNKKPGKDADDGDGLESHWFG